MIPLFHKSAALLLLSSLALAVSNDKIEEAKSQPPPPCGCGEDEIVFDFSQFQQHDYVTEISRNNLFVKAIGNKEDENAQYFTPDLDGPNGFPVDSQIDDMYGNPEGGAARILNSTDPRPDFDLGSPNQQCPSQGPGRGDAGVPNGPGANCNPLGNLLIIQRRDKSRADDSDEGGQFVFTLDRAIWWRFTGMGTLDVPADKQVEIYTMRRDTGEEFRSFFTGVGQNGYQEAGEAASAPVRFHDQVRVVWPGDGGIAWLKFCRNWDDGTTAVAPDLPDGAISAGRRALRS